MSKNEGLERTLNEQRDQLRETRIKLAMLFNIRHNLRRDGEDLQDVNEKIETLKDRLASITEDIHRTLEQLRKADHAMTWQKEGHHEYKY